MLTFGIVLIVFITNFLCLVNSKLQNALNYYVIFTISLLQQCVTEACLN